LAHAAAEPDRRRLQTIEDSGAIAGAAYYNETLPQAAPERAAYMAECRAHDLVFFDPDNGIEAPSVKKSHGKALKYVFLDEVAAVYGSGKSILIYQHFPMMKPRPQFVADTVGRLHIIASDTAIFTFTTSHVVFFLLVHPESPARLAVAAVEACGSLDPAFVRSEYIGRGSPQAQ
jgi:hypothetical protein